MAHQKKKTQQLWGMILFKEHAHILPYKNPYVFLASYAIFPLINVILRI